MSRRRFLKLMSGSLVAAACGPVLPAKRAAPGATAHVRAIAFDLFTIFDPRGVDRRVNDVLGERPEFTRVWKSRLFEYSWIRVASGQYVDFERLVHDSLSYACRAQRVSIDAAQRQQLASAFTELSPWPDSVQALRELKARGTRLAPLANFAPGMIEALLKNAGIRDLFEVLISTDRARSYKPDPRAYALGEQVLGLQRRQIAFAAFGAWDAAGARWYGYPTFWVNRLGVAPEELIAADASGPDLVQLASWVHGFSDGAAGRQRGQAG